MKKILSAILLGLLATLPLTNVSASTESDTSFSDLSSDDPSLEAIEWMAEEDIVGGYPDGTFQSTNPINRAEFMKIVVESIIDNPTGSNCFPDVGEEWFAKYVCYAKEIGLISGYPDGTFKPANEINFAEASKVITKALEIEGITLEENDPWYREYVEPLSDLSAIPLSISDLDKSIARGEMAEVIWRVEEERDDLESLTYEELEGQPVQLQSCEELKTLFLSDASKYQYYWSDIEDSDEAFAEESSVTTESSTESSSGESESVDASTTNVQVEGVDESDKVKNDDEYIYLLKTQAVEIIKAYPAETMEHVGTIDFETEDENFWPSELYLDGDTLVVIGSTSNYNIFDYDYGEAFDTMIDPYYHSSRTGVYIYNVSDPANPILTRSFEFDGDYSDSRKVDETVYLILNKWDLYYYAYDYDPETLNPKEVLPRYYDSSTNEETYLVDCTDIRYLPRERELNYLIAVAIPLEEADAMIDSEVMVGSSENLYSSKENMFIATTNYNSESYYYDWRNAKTLVHRFGLYDGEIEYEQSGKVPGTILNQFSMDEHEDHFRIATTQGHVWDTDIPSTNNLYILDETMDVVGSVEDIAPGETIYSTRFMGDRGYMVTFKKVDPLFVFDLSDPENPQILGELKIPGYSDYLHPYDENHLLGFGKDAEDATEEETATRNLDFAWYQGMKISLFDVTDPTNPTQLFSVGIGDRGTTSELLYDHKALLFSASKGLLAFPIEVAEVTDEDADANTYGEPVFQGAYVYHIDLENGFDLQATLTHYDAESFETRTDWYYYDFVHEIEIERVIYIDDDLFTVSKGMIKAFDLSTFEWLNTLEID